MTPNSEPNPSVRKSEDFPKTTTIPDGWVADSIMAAYNRDAQPAKETNCDDSQPMPVPTTGRTATEHTPDDSLFTRRLEPFPSSAELTGMYL